MSMLYAPEDVQRLSAALVALAREVAHPWKEVAREVAEQFAQEPEVAELLRHMAECKSSLCCGRRYHLAAVAQYGDNLLDVPDWRLELAAYAAVQLDPPRIRPIADVGVNVWFGHDAKTMLLAPGDVVSKEVVQLVWDRPDVVLAAVRLLHGVRERVDEMQVKVREQLQAGLREELRKHLERPLERTRLYEALRQELDVYIRAVELAQGGERDGKE
jgi:hypothetical protein